MSSFTIDFMFYDTLNMTLGCREWNKGKQLGAYQDKQSLKDTQEEASAV